MKLNGKIFALNLQSCLAAADLGKDKALVFQFSTSDVIKIGDLIKDLPNGYQSRRCMNASRNQMLNIQVLTGALPLDFAKFVVGKGPSTQSKME